MLKERNSEEFRHVEISIHPKAWFYTLRYKNIATNLLLEKEHDIEQYITASTYFNRDLIPHGGRYYNREKWLKKLKLWNYP